MDGIDGMDGMDGMDDTEALNHLHTGADYLRLAERTADPAVLGELARRAEYPFVWQAIARNAAAPTEALAALVGRRNSDHNDNRLTHLLAAHPAVTGAALDGLVESVAALLAEGERPYAAVLRLAARPELPAERIRALGRLPGASARLRRGITRALAARTAA
ncbi:hypothetical protein [Streptomyces rubellomurinus]|uniref:hypothetical protein n=1 Tax=Streptomyces rubellomurinus (strain ATCC 31215) TaxID=359131 RepID=UPI001FC9EFA7|nr:hypothetical protein [Streptomyces rubellomurinus]